MVKEAPLADVRVLDLTQFLAGPFCSLLLADMGAEVIKIERPKTGEQARHVGPFVTNEKGERGGGYFLRLARNKRSLTLDLSQAEGKAIFERLVKVSDVVLENFVPGTMEKFGLHYEALREIHPGIVYASISGYGQGGPNAGPFWQRPAFDMVAQALGGVMDLTGEADGPPTQVGPRIGDLFPGTLTAYAIMVALHQRQRSGVGQQIDVAMYDAMVALVEREISNYSLLGEIPTRGKDVLFAPCGPFKAKDGYVSIAVVTEEQWANLCRAMEREDLIDHPQLARGPLRAANLEELVRPLVEGWAADKTKNEVTERLLAFDVAVGPVQNVAELFECPHLATRNMLVEVPDPIIGPRKLAGTPIKLSGYPQPAPKAAPRLGEHTDEVLQTLLGLPSEEIARLRESGTV
ncbi:MAG: CoA transferase [Chloroflexi bacterium]|nr:CoA transferase [Chloroflexota bacterium]